MSFIYPKRKPSEFFEESGDLSYNSDSEIERSPEQERIIIEAREVIFQKLKEKIDAEKLGNNFAPISIVK